MVFTKVKMLDIPDNISALLEIDVMSWSFEQMAEFSDWQLENDVFPSDQVEQYREPEELPCFWERRGLNLC